MFKFFGPKHHIIKGVWAILSPIVRICQRICGWFGLGVFGFADAQFRAFWRRDLESRPQQPVGKNREPLELQVHEQDLLRLWGATV